MSKPKRILIADDEPLYRDTTAELLREEGYECICVEDAGDAIEVLREHSFDLILSDLNMPGNLKMELLKEGRTKYSHIPMIVITGVPSIPSAIESVRLGIADYLLKPVKFEELIVAVERAIAGSGSGRGDESSSNDGFADSAQNTLPLAGGSDAVAAGEGTARSSTLDALPARSSRHFRREDESSIAGAASDIIGTSPKMLEVMVIVDRVAPSNTSVLITGESGTGKEVIARAIHNRSSRAENRLQIIDCTAIPESLFESALFGHVKGAFTGAVKDQAGQLKAADGGTAFFDELGELPLTSQSKLLRVIQEQTFTPVGEDKPIQVDTRFICATNRDLQAEVHAGRFRQDLFYRLAVIHIELPPLRQRGDDIVLLAEHFLQQLRSNESLVGGFSEGAIQCIKRYRWPGNIRELRNVVERSITLARGEQIEVDDLPAAVGNPSQSQNEGDQGFDLAEVSRDEALDTADHAYLTRLLEKHHGVIASAARQAGLSRQGMNKLLKRHGIDADEYRK
ncbi:sigma-54-dependent transcriptional regulator [Roseiconus nitratireducens]|nr:sigma-54 dependent transcriptional regulator [Roseiconus nitratireducens]